MDRSPRFLRRRVALALAVGSLTLGACGASTRSAEPAPTTTDVTTTTTTDVTTTTTTTTTEGSNAWAPAGSRPPVILDSPGDGGTIRVQVGERVQLPHVAGLDGIRFNPNDRSAVSSTGQLVPYGNDYTFLAIAPGRVRFEETVYDPSRSCVPPQPIAEFELIIEGDQPIDLGDPVAVSAVDDGKGVSLTPGQRLDWDQDLILSVDDGDQTVVNAQGFALQPGVAEVSLSTVPSPSSTDQWVTFTVTVIDPDNFPVIEDAAPAPAKAEAAPASTDTVEAPPALRRTPAPSGPTIAPACG